MPARTLVNPLPRRFLTEEPGIGGVIKARPGDFVVEEVPLYEPCGEGEHVYVGVEKTGVSHAEMMSCLRRHYGAPERAIGFAGMKDKAAVTRQTVSIHRPRRPDPGPLPHERIRVLWSSRHTNKIRLGHLAGNRFVIRIRDADPARAPEVRRALQRLEATGAPNYFGSQRFGYRTNNHVLGLAILRADWQGVLDELLGASGSAFPDYQRERRELYDRGRYAEAAELWTPADRNELTVIKALASGREGESAVRAVGPNAMSFWISALQSAVFNRVLDRRLEDGTLMTLVEGDLAWKHDNGAVFRVTAGELADPALARRAAALEISPSGPLWAAAMTRAAGVVDAAEVEALGELGLSPDALGAEAARLKGARRPLRIPVHHTTAEPGVDEHGPYLQVSFDLPGGAYATVLVGEMQKRAISH